MEYNKESLEKFCKIHGGHLPCAVCGFKEGMSVPETVEHENVLRREAVLNHHIVEEEK